MIKLLALLFLILLHGSTASAQSENKKIEAAVIGFFNGMSLLNDDTLKHYTSIDFQLLEDGEVWNMDTLLHKIRPGKGRNIKRVNAFEFIRVEQEDSRAWISYYNTAVFSQGDKSRTVKWLESVVLVKQAGRWRIQLMHSTVVKP